MTIERELAGKVAIVTGAARNIGRSIALALADAGASVVVGARRDEEAAKGVVEEIRQRGGDAHFSIGDVANEDDVAALVDTAISRFGRLDILVNNAAIRNEKLITEMSYAEWRAVTSVILDGAFLCTRAAVPHLIKVGGGSIISIGGIAAYAGVSTRSHVAAAKAGLGGLTRALAKELTPQGITVNLVAPGRINTTKVAPAPGERLPEPGRYQPITDRIGQPDEVASLVRYLAGSSARYITGQTLHINGGAFLP